MGLCRSFRHCPCSSGPASRGPSSSGAACQRLLPNRSAAPSSSAPRASAADGGGPATELVGVESSSHLHGPKADTSRSVPLGHGVAGASRRQCLVGLALTATAFASPAAAAGVGALTLEEAGAEATLAPALTLEAVTRAVTPAGPLSARWVVARCTCTVSGCVWVAPGGWCGVYICMHALAVCAPCREAQVIDVFESNMYSVVNIIDLTLVVRTWERNGRPCPGGQGGCGP